ncbi:MAG: hypothetical protein P8R42_23040, partial [Candidatus Binatia bacterium]|nr:hypothetical protein [Candidatus Binatia bacterium]
KQASSPKKGGSLWRPKTGERVLDCRKLPAIFQVLERRRRASLKTGRRDYVFTDSLGKTLSQDWLHKRVFKPTLRKLGIAHRGQNDGMRDTFITLSLSAGEDPGWVAKFCGTSERMIWEHYRAYLPDQADGSRVSAALLSVTRLLPETTENEDNPAKTGT